MRIASLYAFAPLVFLITISLTTGCSGSREDARVTLCKNLTTALMDSDQALVWKGNENRFQRPAFVEVKVLFELPDATDGEAVCVYAYDTVEENVLTHTQPLSAYATQPYEMKLLGKPVGTPVLKAAIQSEQRQIFMKILDSFNNLF